MLQSATPSEMAHSAALSLPGQPRAAPSIVGHSKTPLEAGRSAAPSVVVQATPPSVVGQSAAPSVISESELLSVAGQSAAPFVPEATYVMSRSAAPFVQRQARDALQSPQAAAAPLPTAGASCSGVLGAAPPLLHPASKLPYSLQPCLSQCALPVVLSPLSPSSAACTELSIPWLSPLCCMALSLSETIASSPSSAYNDPRLPPRPLPTFRRISLPRQSPQLTALRLLFTASLPNSAPCASSSTVALDICSSSDLKGQQFPAQQHQQISTVPASVSHGPPALSSTPPDFSRPIASRIRCLTQGPPPYVVCRGCGNLSGQRQMTAGCVSTINQQIADNAVATPETSPLCPNNSRLLSEASAVTAPAAADHAAADIPGATAFAVSTSAAAASGVATRCAANASGAAPRAASAPTAALPLPAAAAVSLATSSLPAAAPNAVAALCRSSLQAAAFSKRQSPMPLLPRALPFGAHFAGSRKRRKGGTVVRLLSGAVGVPPAAASSPVRPATAATLSTELSAASEGMTVIKETAVLKMAVVTDITSAAFVDTEPTAGTARRAQMATADRRRDEGGAVRTAARPYRPLSDRLCSASAPAPTAGCGVAVEDCERILAKERKLTGGTLDTLKGRRAIVGDCVLGVVKSMAAAATGAAAAGRSSQGDRMTVATATATRAAVAAAAGAMAARLIAVTGDWGAAATAEKGRAVDSDGGESTRSWGRRRDSENTSPVGLLKLFPFSFSPWGVLVGIVVVAIFHVCLFWGASWFFSKHLFREHQQKRLSVQHLFAFTFTVCVAMLQLLLLELLHVLHPTLRRWVWHGDLVCVLLLLYLILPVSIVYNLVVRSGPLSAPGAEAALHATSISSCTDVALRGFEESGEEEEEAKMAADKMRGSARAGAEAGGNWDASNATPVIDATATAQQHGRWKIVSNNREWGALVLSEKKTSFYGTLAETATVCGAEEQQQLKQTHYPLIKLGVSVMRWWGCGRRRSCNSSIHAKKRLLQQVQHQLEEEENEGTSASERLYEQVAQDSRYLPRAAAATVAEPGFRKNYYNTISDRGVLECTPAAPCHLDDRVGSHPLSVEPMAADVTCSRAVCASAATTAAAGYSELASKGELAAGAAEACLSPSCAILSARRMSSALLARKAQKLPCSLQRWAGQQMSGDTGSLQRHGVQQEAGAYNYPDEQLNACGERQQEVQQEATRGACSSAKGQESQCSSNCRLELATGGRKRVLSSAALLSLRMAVAGDGLSSQQDSGGNCSSASYNARNRLLFVVFAICCVMLPLLWMCFYQSGRLLHLDPVAVASLSFMECLLAYVGICGVTVVSALAGFGSVNFPYRILFASFSKISQSQVEELEQRLLHTLSLIAEKKKKTLKLQQAAVARKTAARCCFWLAPSSSCCSKDSSRRKGTAVATPHHHGSRAAAAAALQGGDLQQQYHRMVQQDHQCTTGISGRSRSSNSSILVHPQRKLLRQQQIPQPHIPKDGSEGLGSVASAWMKGDFRSSSLGPKLKEEVFTAGKATDTTDFAAVAVQRQQDWGRRIDEAPGGEEPEWQSGAAARSLTAKAETPETGLQQHQPLQGGNHQQRQHLLQEHRHSSSAVWCAYAEEETGMAAGANGSTFFSRLLKRGGRRCTYTRLAPQHVMAKERGEQQRPESLSRPSRHPRSGCSSTRRRGSGLVGGEGSRNGSEEGFHAKAGSMEGIGSCSSNSRSSSGDEVGRETSAEFTQDEEKNPLSLMERGYGCSSSNRNRVKRSRLQPDADNYCSGWSLSRRWKESVGGKWKSNTTRRNNGAQEELSLKGRANGRKGKEQGTGALDWLQAWRDFFAEELAVPSERGEEAATKVDSEIELLAAAEAGISLRREGGWDAAAGDRQVGRGSLRERGRHWKDSGSTSASTGAACTNGGGPATRRGWLPSRIWNWACGVLQQQPHEQQWLWAGVRGMSNRVKDKEEEGEAQQHLQSEITALEELSRELFVALDNLVQSRAQALYRETVVGRLHSLLAWIMTGVCIFRVGSAGFNVLCGRSSAGVGAAGAAVVPQADPATRALEAVLQQLQVPVNVAAVSPYLSLLLLSCIIALTIRNFVEKLLTVFRHISTSSVWTANVLALVMAEIMGFYFSACVLLTRVYLPPAYQDAVTQILAPSLDFRVFHLHFDRVFLVSCLVSFAVILFSHRHVTEKLKSF